MWNKNLASRFLPKMLAARYTPGGKPMGAEYVDETFLLLSLTAAIALHIGGIYAWSMMPATEVMDIPVRALSIKLGDGEPLTPEEEAIPPAGSGNAQPLENALSQVVRDQEEVQARTKSVVNSIDKAFASDKDNASKALDKAVTEQPSAEAAAAIVQESARKISNIAKQFVRSNAIPTPGAKGSGSLLGNSTAKESEMMSRYEQLISLWIEKFKRYPEEARAAGMQGETVVRIRIDRKGTIRYYILERSTGYPALDHAAIDMVKRANPVPAVPNDYPPGDLIEFLIPVNYHLQ